MKSGPAKSKKAKKTRALLLAGILVLAVIAGGLVLLKPATKGWATAEEACGESLVKAKEAIEAVIPEIPFMNRNTEGGMLLKKLQDLQDAVNSGNKKESDSAAGTLANNLSDLASVLSFTDKTKSKVNDAIKSLRDCSKKCRK